MNVRESKVKIKKYDEIKVGQVFCDCYGFLENVNDELLDDNNIHLIGDLFYLRTNYSESAISLHNGEVRSFLPDEKIIAVETFKINIVEAPDLIQQLNEISPSCGFVFNKNIYVKSLCNNESSILCIDVTTGCGVWVDNDADVRPLRIEGVYR